MADAATRLRVQQIVLNRIASGSIVNEKPTLCRKKIRQLRAILHRAKHEGLAAQNRENRPKFRAWLEGSIAFLAMTRPELGQQMRSQLETLTE